MFPKLKNVKQKYFTQNSNDKCKRTTEGINFARNQITYFKKIIEVYSEAQEQNKYVKDVHGVERNVFIKIRILPQMELQMSPNFSKNVNSFSVN